MARPKPLSVGQESLWFLHQLAPSSAAYNDAGATRLRPVPDLPALARAVSAVVERHELLRSRFIDGDGGPARSVCGPELVELETRDARGLDDAELARAAQAVALAPFALSTDGPLRVVLLWREPDAVLVVADHHIATDATSQYLLWRDLLTAYRGYAAGSEPAWSPLGGSYDDYVAAEQRLLASSRRGEQERYWLGVCTGAEAAELRTDRPRPHRPAFTGASRHRRLPAELAQRVRDTAARLGVTPFGYLLGVFQALLHRYTGQEDFLVGCPTTTRRTRRSRNVVGYYVNTLVLRSRFQPSTTFADAAAAAGQEVRRATRHVGYPYPLLLQALGRSPAAGIPPPFRVAVTMVTASRFGATLDLTADGQQTVYDSGLQLEPVDVPRLEGQQDLNVELTQGPTSLAVTMRYDASLFDATTVDQLLSSYLRLIEQSTAEPSTKVSRASLLGDEERARLLALGNGS